MPETVERNSQKHELEEIRLEAFKTALQTRNFEIQLFWQRSNYFLVLNTAIGTGFFVIKKHELSVLLGSFGIAASVLWLLVNLGSKFWQSRWEQQVEDQEKLLAPVFDRFFGVDKEGLAEIVKESLADAPWWRPDRHLWYFGVLRRPSVSYMMTLLSCAFIAFWIAAVILIT